MASNAKLKFYSSQELKELQPYINGKKFDKTYIEEFCKRNNRNYNSVIAKIYNSRKTANTTKTTVEKFKKEAILKPIKKTKSDINMTKGEFKIPITNWSVTQDNNQFYFVVKF